MILTFNIQSSLLLGMDLLNQLRFTEITEIPFKLLNREFMYILSDHQFKLMWRNYT
jgi:hypothetical protein